MSSFFAEKQTRTTEDEGRRTEYQLGAGEVLDEFAKLPDEDGELSLKLFDMAPSVKLDLVSVCLLPIRIIGKIIGRKVATKTDGSYSGEAAHNAATKALERLEKQVGMLLVKDLEAAKEFFASALRQWRAGNGDRARHQFEEALRLSIEAYSTLNPMEKVVCTELRICAAAGCMTDEELKVEAQEAIDKLVHDKSLVKELKDTTFFLSSSKKKNYQLLYRCCSMVNATIEKLHGIDSSLPLPAEWNTAIEVDGKLFTDSIADKMGASKYGKRVFKDHDLPSYKTVLSVTFSSDAKYIASGSEEKSIKLWEVSTGKCVRTLKGHSDLVKSVAFSPDGKYIASGSGDKTVRIWDVESGEGVKTLKGHSSWVNSVAFSPNGKYIASGSSDKSIKLWNVITGKCVRTLEGHSYHVRSAAFSPDSKYIASGSDDETVKVWSVESGECVWTSESHNPNPKGITSLKFGVYSVAFSPNGQWIASGSHDDTVRLWRPMYPRTKKKPK